MATVQVSWAAIVVPAGTTVGYVQVSWASLLLPAGGPARIDESVTLSEEVVGGPLVVATIRESCYIIDESSRTATWYAAVDEVSDLEESQDITATTQAAVVEATYVVDGLVGTPYYRQADIAESVYLRDTTEVEPTGSDAESLTLTDAVAATAKVQAEVGEVISIAREEFLGEQVGGPPKESSQDESLTLADAVSATATWSSAQAEVVYLRERVVTPQDIWTMQPPTAGAWTTQDPNAATWTRRAA